MKIAQVVATTGAEAHSRDIERSAGYLTTQLVADGHEVTLLTCVVATSPVFSSSRVRSRLRPMPDSLDRLIAEHSNFDVIHLHGDLRRLSALHDIVTPIVATMYAHPTPATLAARSPLPEPTLIALTDYQRALFMGLRWHGTILPGLPERLHTFHIDSENYLAYVGPLQSMTGVRRALEAALHSGLPLKIADRIVGRELRQLEQQLAPYIERGASVEFVGEMEPGPLGDFLGRARALLFMDEWSTPLPLVLLDALACGTPIIAWRSGTSETVVRDGETGFLASSVDDAALAIRRLHEINRLACRRMFDERFSVKRMTHEYVRLYEDVQRAACRPLVSDAGGLLPRAELGQDGMV